MLKSRSETHKLWWMIDTSEQILWMWLRFWVKKRRIFSYHDQGLRTLRVLIIRTPNWLCYVHLTNHLTVITEIFTNDKNINTNTRTSGTEGLRGGGTLPGMISRLTNSPFFILKRVKASKRKTTTLLNITHSYRDSITPWRYSALVVGGTYLFPIPNIWSLSHHSGDVPIDLGEIQIFLKKYLIGYSHSF